MNTVSIAGIKVPVFQNKKGFIPSQTIIETDTTIKNLQNILYPLLDNQSILLVGDAGVGKNALIYYINNKRNLPTIRYSFNEDTLSEDLIGSYRLLLDNKGFEWVNGPIVTALKSGISFVADEMNLSSPNVLKRFSTVYQSKYIDLVEGNGEKILAENGFNFIATQNPSEGFEGRKSISYDITKSFSIVYIDPYSPDELLFILKNLYPELTESILISAISITLETEKRIIENELGKGDLEKYHFNLRTLKKLANRFMKFNCSDSEIAYREIYQLYVEPFRKAEDRVKQSELVQKIIQYSPKMQKNISFDLNENTLFCNDKQMQTDENRLKSIFASIPVTESIKEFLEKLITSLQMNENTLIEFKEEDDIHYLLPLITNLSSEKLESIHLSKGIHTNDILGALKPVSESKVEWVDGPLTKGVKSGATILISGLETVGAELVEKLNMLTDDARSLSIPAESGNIEPIQMKESSRIIGLKMFRKTKSTPTISRAFRNRFTSILFPDLEEEKTLHSILDFYFEDENISSVMKDFHFKIKEFSSKRLIGSANLTPYTFGLSNLLKWKDHIFDYVENESIEVILFRGAKIHYTNQIADPKERKEMEKLLELTLKKHPLPFTLNEKLKDKKKTFTESVNLDKSLWWDPSLHKREANTGKAELKNSGQALKKGIEINTPETGGNTKEGADAWYGSETRGNMGQGEPAGGGGAWGYRTDELYKQFLAKRKILWNYSMTVSLEEYKNLFSKSLEEVEMNLESLFDPDIDITRMYKSEGKRIDARKYISFINGRGDSKVFDKTILDKQEEKLKGVEVVFLVCKARRIFNFEYSVATLSAMLSSAHILNEHNVKFSIYSYSDRLNQKDHIDLICLKEREEDYSPLKEEEMFNSLTKDWQGDSVYEYSLIEDCERYFSTEAQTKIIVIISDFRGQRGKVEIEREIDSYENKKLKQEVLKNTKKDYVFLAVGLGNRYIAENIFESSIQITADNFSNMPNLIGSELTRLIHTHHSLRT
jgi:MoxR-like ATPase